MVVVVALESAGVPLPGETVLVSAAVYAGTTHNMNIAGVIGAAAAGAIVGDNIGFWIGREAGPPILERFGDMVGLDARRRKLGQYLFLRYGGAIVFFGRFVAFLRAYAALLAGVNRLEPLRFFVFNATGGVAWATIFGLGGYALGASFHRIAGPFGLAMLALAIVALVAGWRFYRHHEERLLDEAERIMNARGAA
ncbi:MAG: DedA family protein [Rhodoblastus sp.]